MPNFRLVALTALALAALPMVRVRADRVDAFVPQGKTATVTVASPADVATATFLVQDGNGKKVSLTVKPAAKSKLALDVRLVAPDGAVFDAAAIGLAKGKVKATTRLVTISLPNIPDARGGLWRVEVRGKDGSTGGATVQFKATDTTKLTVKNQTVPVGGSLSKTIDVGTSQQLTVTVKRGAGSKLAPKLQILDPNGDPLQDGLFLGSFSAKTGTLSLKNFRMPVFGTYTLVVTGGTTGGLCTITANTSAAKIAKKKPTAVPGGPTDAEFDSPKVLDATASRTAFGGALAFRWSQIAGEPVELTGATTSSPSFVAPTNPIALGFECAVAENGVWSIPVAVPVEVGKRPAAYAGRSMVVATGAPVTLDGSLSVDRSPRGLTYVWKQDTDDAVQVPLTGANTAAPTFTAPATDAVLHFGLTVDDGALRSFEDPITVRVGAGDVTPDAGRDQFVPRMATVHLSALGTRTASGLMDAPLQWTKVQGPDVVMNNTTSPFLSFQAPKQSADLLFRLTAGGATDEVWVHVRPGETNLAPLTRMSLPAGVISAAAGPVTLNAGQSGDPNTGDTVTYRWAQLSGPALPVAAEEAKSTTVNLPAGNEIRRYCVQTFDGLAFGNPDWILVRNNPYTGAPTASAGDDITLTLPNQTIQLNGSGALSGGPGPLTFRWRQVTSLEWFDVDARVPTFDPTAAKPLFNLPVTLSSLTPRRTITMELIVNDGVQDSAADFVTVTYNNLPRNGLPTVDISATPTNPIAGQTVQLSATTFDDDGDAVSVSWSQTSPPPIVTLTGGAASVNPSFVAPASGTLTFKCVPRDFESTGPFDTVTVIVDAAPTARLKVTPTQGSAGTPITIDATTSSDPENQSLTYTLSQVSGAPVDLTPAELTNTTGVWQATPGAAATWRLVVTDGRQNSSGVTASFSTALPVDVAPAASPNNAAYGATVTLNANATGTGPYTYLWKQLTGGVYAGNPACTITNTTAASPTFKVPKPGGTGGFGASPSATFEVTGSNGATQATKTVTVTFFASLNDKAGSGVATGDTVYGIMSQNCGGQACHSTGGKCGSTAAGYQFLGSATVFLNANNNVVSCAGKVRVSPNSATNSYLMDRLKGIATPQMPSGGAGPLSAATIFLIEDWINQGALDN